MTATSAPAPAQATAPEDGWARPTVPSELTIAVAKGRVAEQPRHLFAPSASGAERPEERRQLSRIGSARVLYPHNWDVPRYLACGLADGGVLGQDVLLETGLRVTDEVDLAVARCRLSLIRRVGFAGRIRRVATRYPRLASRYLSRSQGVEVVSGNVELACVVGLADAVIDIVATGTTLRVHRLEEVEAIMESTARFVVPRPRHGGSAESAEEMLRRLGADVEV